jgi:hypothetical protein
MKKTVTEINPEQLAKRCESFQQGTKRLFEGERIKAMKGDMWLFELYHHLTDCAAVLRKCNAPIAGHRE